MTNRLTIEEAEFGALHGHPVKEGLTTQDVYRQLLDIMRENERLKEIMHSVMEQMDHASSQLEDGIIEDQSNKDSDNG